MHDTYGTFWRYLSQELKDLIQEGDYLINDVIRHQSYQFKDYSFLVFPYAKAYEGFLKQLFLDTKLISRVDFISDHLRLGKLMSPNLVGRLRERSLYKKITEKVSKDLADRIWMAWKVGRNQTFHYFPHNYKALTFEEAEQIVKQIVNVMEEAYQKLAPEKPIGKTYTAISIN
ncbi:hypothetical protein A3G67_02455 [Candidatus Roizmanbacteria bacterium RIFCSPLOWO2_12_FULL_40_12]|uniref:Bacterial toxin RNase RnlA/LsoA DBD domain-containing protein n=1 Tax=Candidatus Roizmanbacteria bacterium RIFCSPLOWO2_01_FULL_40_42 TaxID=1802066 RepID=A0A1F7J6E7_9BACT|nr:MAG: hypothetical protein A2779_00160 [Candidatus Roizmanbacteria bacterium RIFCSPHIGHO2_01_FULL_40_98]OGK29126.1 MAG: hypothetical protein A3C31_01230 [Candidatus Roizmanbacteria bacterium RIFCSPHIGHO2_02_FULL_40_53]OGK29661.1 MAG: hypothetical protein A2W49_05130 [Candidatus Roizmanbacteria bacterium RIFCSPHIGHO2_12_41_18]OGK37401.1 MAG: hypothetical protein A3E69_01125 [Candidatus Roizmanbacteria bacterium RIFCSPHIGHO2_12_FULL_40_130]OGK51171.1 MAG: hypothetical protein A3B50_04365 [Candi